MGGIVCIFIYICSFWHRSRQPFSVLHPMFFDYVPIQTVTMPESLEKPRGSFWWELWLKLS